MFSGKKTDSVVYLLTMFAAIEYVNLKREGEERNF